MLFGERRTAPFFCLLMRRIPLAAGVKAISIALLLLVSFGNAQATAKTLTVAIGLAPSSFVLRTNCSNILFALAYDPLIRVDENGQYAPGLAESWFYSDNNTTFTMKIRTGVKFQDGTPITPQTVVATLLHNRDNPGINQGYLAPFKSIEVVNGDMVQIKYDRPFKGMETLLSADGECNNGLIISPEGLANPDRMSTEMFGSGAYRLNKSETLTGDRYVFDRNDNYWDPAHQHWDRVVIRVIADPNTAFEALRSGEIQVSMLPLDANAQSQLAGQAKTEGFQVAEGLILGYGINIFDRNGELVPALKDQRVRQAMNYAIDRESLLAVLGPKWRVMGQFAVPNLMGYDPKLDGRYPYDPEKAKQLLTEAGYADGFDLPLLDQDMSNAAQAIAAMYAQVGIRVELQRLADPNSWVSDVAQKKYAAMAPSFALLGDVYFDAVRLLVDPYFGPWSPFKTKDAEVEAAYDAVSKAGTQGEFEALNVELNRIVTEKAWFVPIAVAPRYAFAKGVKDLGKASPIGEFFYLNWAPAQ
ncbi:ABC transporter substrate-binding protein [Rhizobium sp. ICMP 5592]|uniref:ABC transporter substrate-binding protein n=1 Tax=Rhizobium sp. ICMP 5592 TaxID=2292445 RepID=UPI00188676FB|nr:ABC transporter substrate-binding protein [Rhizobium sp. ICMP 5592]